MAFRLRRLLKRLGRRAAAQGLLRTLGYLTFTVVLERWGLEVAEVFEHVSQPDRRGCHGVYQGCVANSTAAFAQSDLQRLRAYGGETILEDFERAFDRRELCVLCRLKGGELAGVCWFTIGYVYPAARGCPCVLFERGFTFPEYRGRGVLPAALRYAVRWLRLQREFGGRIFAECSVFNNSSARAIAKAGFTSAGLRLRAWRRVLFLPRRQRRGPRRCTTSRVS